MGSLYNQESKTLVGKTLDEDLDDVVKLYRFHCRSDEAVMKELARGKHFHALEDHNFHIRRFGRCPYCDAFPGSKVVPRSVLKELKK